MRKKVKTTFAVLKNIYRIDDGFSLHRLKNIASINLYIQGTCKKGRDKTTGNVTSTPSMQASLFDEKRFQMV